MLLPKLHLNEAAIRYFGELVIKYKSNQIIRRSKADKYLLLLGFTSFQIRNYEDQLVDILLAACRSAIRTSGGICTESYAFDFCNLLKP